MANKGDVSGALFKWFTLAFLLEVKEPHDPDSLAAAAGCNSAIFSFFLYISVHLFLFRHSYIPFIPNSYVANQGPTTEYRKPGNNR